MNNPSLLVAHAAIARRVTDAEQRRRARGCRTVRPLATVIPHRSPSSERHTTMSTAQWILNVALLGWVLTRNLGTHRVTPATFLVPLAVVATAGAWFLRDLPTDGHDLDLELIGIAAGLALGTLAALLTRMHRRQGHLVVSAGTAFAAVWIATIGGRMLFAQWATHSGARTIGEFSMRHQITGADAWTAAFVLMALTMVAVRLLVTAVQVSAHRSPSAALAEAGAE